MTNIEEPLISIITISKNAELFIENTMRSVLSQTYGNMEYILVDGKSTDNTLNIIHRIATKYPNNKIKIISEEDKGISDAMNKGIEFAHGEVISHLHAGDYYIDECVIEKVVDSFVKDTWRWGVASSVVVDSNGCQKYTFTPQNDYRILLKQNCIPHQSTFLAAAVFAKNGLFRVDYRQAMDYEYWLRIAFKGGERYRVLPFCTTCFLDGGRSSNVLELMGCVRKLRKTMNEYGCKTSIVRDWIFLARIGLFYVLYELRKNLIR